MRSVLVNQVQPAVILGDDIGSVMLADIIQLGKLRKTSVSLLNRCVQLPGRLLLPPASGGCLRTVAVAEAAKRLAV